MLDTGEILIRLGAATFAGMALGLDRELEAKPIGIRTLSLVSLGAAMASVIAVNNAAWDNHPDALARVTQGLIQGILTGIGFLGAGLILQVPDKSRVKFLTSAATVWVTATLGMACGLGQWAVALAGAGFSLGILVFMRPFDAWLQARKATLLTQKQKRNAEAASSD